MLAFPGAFEASRRREPRTSYPHELCWFRRLARLDTSGNAESSWLQPKGRPEAGEVADDEDVEEAEEEAEEHGWAVPDSW